MATRMFRLAAGLAAIAATAALSGCLKVDVPENAFFWPEASLASAVKAPPRAVRTQLMLAFRPMTLTPCELAATAKARSARVKTAPPWTVPRLLRWCGCSASRVRAQPAPLSTISMPV